MLQFFPPIFNCEITQEKADKFGKEKINNYVYVIFAIYVAIMFGQLNIVKYIIKKYFSNKNTFPINFEKDIITFSLLFHQINILEWLHKAAIVNENSYSDIDINKIFTSGLISNPHTLINGYNYSRLSLLKWIHNREECSFSYGQIFNDAIRNRDLESMKWIFSKYDFDFIYETQDHLSCLQQEVNSVFTYCSEDPDILEWYWDNRGVAWIEDMLGNRKYRVSLQITQIDEK